MEKIFSFILPTVDGKNKTYTVVFLFKNILFTILENNDINLNIMYLNITQNYYVIYNYMYCAKRNYCQICVH